MNKTDTIIQNWLKEHFKVGEKVLVKHNYNGEMLDVGIYKVIMSNRGSLLMHCFTSESFNYYYVLWCLINRDFEYIIVGNSFSLEAK